MTIRSFEDLIIWNKAHALTLEIYEITKHFPTDERYGLVSQIRRSTSSICANISEGYQKSRKDYIRYLDISRGSLEETKYHLILSRDLKYLSIDSFKKLFNLTEEIGKIMFKTRQSLSSI